MKMRWTSRLYPKRLSRARVYYRHRFPNDNDSRAI